MPQIMRKKLPLLPVLFLLSAASCKKTSSSTGGTLTGSWSLIDIVAHTSSSVDQVYGGDNYEDVTISDYTTTNNAGTISFNGGLEKSSGITYEANFTALDSIYMDGQLMETTTSAYDITLPATTSSSKYELIGSDSIYYPAGGAFTMGTSSGTQTTPVGSRFTIHGDTLVLVTIFHQVTTQNYGGVPTTQTEDIFETAYLKKE